MGFICALLLAFFMSIRMEWSIIDLIRDNIVAIFYALIAVELVPAAIYILKIYKKISRKK